MLQLPLPLGEVAKPQALTERARRFHSMPGDLHNHTTYSDGSVPVARLPLMAARVAVSYTHLTLPTKP